MKSETPRPDAATPTTAATAGAAKRGYTERKQIAVLTQESEQTGNFMFALSCLFCQACGTKVYGPQPRSHSVGDRVALIGSHDVHDANGNLFFMHEDMPATVIAENTDTGMYQLQANGLNRNTMQSEPVLFWVYRAQTHEAAISKAVAAND